MKDKAIKCLHRRGGWVMILKIHMILTERNEKGKRTIQTEGTPPPKAGWVPNPWHIQRLVGGPKVAVDLGSWIRGWKDWVGPELS